jgi:hypothetical protein
MRGIFAAGAAENLREELGLGDFVRLQQVLAASETHVVGCGEEIGCMRGGACLAAALAMTVVAADELAVDDEGDAAAQTTSAHSAGRIQWLAIGQDLGFNSLWISFVARQVVGDVVPRRLRSDEDVKRRPCSRVLFHVSAGDEDQSLPRVARYGRPAMLTETTCGPFRRGPACDVRFAVEREVGRRRGDRGHERGSMRLRQREQWQCDMNWRSPSTSQRTAPQSN